MGFSDTVLNTIRLPAMVAPKAEVLICGQASYSITSRGLEADVCLLQIDLINPELEELGKTYHVDVRPEAVNGESYFTKC